MIKNDDIKEYLLLNRGVNFGYVAQNDLRYYEGCKNSIFFVAGQDVNILFYFCVQNRMKVLSIAH